MNISFGERLIKIEVENLRKKLSGIGGKNLGPHDKVTEINNTIKKIRKIQHDQKQETFFSTREYKNILSGLEKMLEPNIPN
jgi:hypothetical protein